MEFDRLIQKLYEAKQAENVAIERRRAIEKELEQLVPLPDEWEGSQTRPSGAYKVTLKRDMNVKIDADMLRELARKNNLTDVLDTCFRWKPELAKKAWKATDENVRKALAPALTTKPGKVSFEVKLLDEKGE